jgi:hypothetical protein
MQADDLIKAQLSLSHSYSWAKLKFNVKQIDDMIIQATALLNQLDKDVKLFSCVLGSGMDTRWDLVARVRCRFPTSVLRMGGTRNLVMNVKNSHVGIQDRIAQNVVGVCICAYCKFCLEADRSYADMSEAAHIQSMVYLISRQ